MTTDQVLGLAAQHAGGRDKRLLAVAQAGGAYLGALSAGCCNGVPQRLAGVGLASIAEHGAAEQTYNDQ